MTSLYMYIRDRIVSVLVATAVGERALNDIVIQNSACDVVTALAYVIANSIFTSLTSLSNNEKLFHSVDVDFAPPTEVSNPVQLVQLVEVQAKHNMTSLNVCASRRRVPSFFWPNPLPSSPRDWVLSSAKDANHGRRSPPTQIGRPLDARDVAAGDTST